MQEVLLEICLVIGVTVAIGSTAMMLVFALDRMLEKALERLGHTRIMVLYFSHRKAFREWSSRSLAVSDSDKVWASLPTPLPYMMAGDLLRQARLSEGIGLREFGQLTGLEPSVLSDVQFGRQLMNIHIWRICSEAIQKHRNERMGIMPQMETGEV